MSLHSRPNSWVAEDDATTASLTYGLQVSPAPLTVSIAGDSPMLGSLEFIITNPTGSPIAVTAVRFIFSVGTASTNLTPTTAGVLTDVSDSTTWQVESPGTITSGTATYTMQPKTGSTGTIPPRASVVVQIFNFQTIENPGNSTVTVKETIGGLNNFVNFQVTTFPAGFYFNGLGANVPHGSDLVPAAQVPAGTAVTLVWNSSVVSLTSFEVLYSSATQGQQKASPTGIGKWVSPPLTSDTVFTLVVTAAVAGGTPLTAAQSTAVAVQNPALVAATLTAGGATINGKLDVTSALTAGTLQVRGTSILGGATADTLSVEGQSNLGAVSAKVLNAASIHTTGDAFIGGGVQSTGMLVSGNGVLSNTVNVTGKSTIFGLPSAFTNHANPQTVITYLTTYAPPSQPYGVITNSRIATTAGESILTHLPTSKGHRVVTSPLSLNSALIFSGSGGGYGSAAVQFDPEVVEMIAGAAYEVSMTAVASPGSVGPPQPLAVFGKSPTGFYVSGNGSFSFDWIVIARKAKSQGSQEPDQLPTSLPEFPQGKEGGE
jgi:hypothetical protein